MGTDKPHIRWNIKAIQRALSEIVVAYDLRFCIQRVKPV